MNDSLMISQKATPRLGVVGMAYGGYNLGEELGPAKLAEMGQRLATQPLTLCMAGRFVLTEADARSAGEELARAQVDCVLAVITTFVPDYFITELLAACDKPVFLWCVEREMSCISVVCGPLITATLFNLEKRYALHGADLDDAATREELLTFARAAMLVRVLRTARVGFCGGRCPIMLSLSVDEVAIERHLGMAVVNIPIEEFYDLEKRIPEKEAGRYWADIKARVGRVTAQDADGMQASRYYLAAKQLVEKNRLDALSLNCFPQLKSKICLGMARLNDAGIAAACEGDLHSTILMHALSCLTGRPAFNGDWLRMYPEEREVLFSHCGAGAFGLADSPKSVCLQCSIETQDGLAVCYATRMRGPVTLANLMVGPAGLRLACLAGEAVETDLQYEGTPLKVRFAENPNTILQRIARCGAGHHWNGAEGAFTPELELLCGWTGVKFNHVSQT
jgi:L-arabinose isomerase